MTQFTETTTTTYTVTCPECDSQRVHKAGTQRGEQRYRCNGCGKKFRAGGKAKGRRMDAEMVGSAIRDIYSGKSHKQVAEALHDEYNLPVEPSKATIYEWTRDYTDRAKALMKGHKAKVGGGHWVADELQLKVGGNPKVWLWNIMDSETRYVVASHLTPRHDAGAARAVLRKALAAADGPPKTITTDKWRSYIKPIKELMPEAKHMQSQGMTADINNNLSERLQGTFRDRVKTLRGLDSLKTGQRYLDGWVINYNFFKGHEALNDDTPGKRAKVNPPFKEWADVVKAGAASRRKVETTEARPTSQSKPKSPQPEAAPVAPRERPKGRKPPLREAAPGASKHGARKRSKVAPPKPVFPREPGKARKPQVAPPWERARPRLPRLPSKR